MFKPSLAGCLALILSLYSGTTSAKLEAHSNNEIPRTHQNIHLDGSLEEDAWLQALKISLNYEVSPGENIAAGTGTIAYLIEDGLFLYVGFKAEDSTPANIQAYLSERDDIEDSDFVSISLDTFSDSRKAYKFSVNAIGVQADSIIDEVTESEDSGWDSIWESTGKLHNDGYVIEMAIPLKSLRFEDKKDTKRWKIKLSRVWPRDVKHLLSNVKDDRNNDCDLCQYQQIQGFANTTPASNITLIPAVTFAKSDSRDITDNPDWINGDTKERGSLDLRWGINQNIFLNATVNPDFSQVEADSIQLENNKRFAIFTSEKRAFFLDGTDYFSNWSRLIYTKLFTEPEYGVKLTGKSGDHSYGFISLKDKDTNFLLSDNQSSRLIRMVDEESQNQILRYRYDSGEKGNFGFTYTGRKSDNYDNELASFDGKYWLNSSGYFKFQVIATDTRNPDSITNQYPQEVEQSGNAYSFNYTHQTRDWTAVLTHHRFEQGFRADSGFVSRSNWISSSVQLARNWYPTDQNQWWKKVTIDYLGRLESDIQGTSLNKENSYGIEVDAIYQSTFGLYFNHKKRSFVQQNTGVNSVQALLDNEFTTDNYGAYLEFTPLAPMNLNIDYYWGDEIEFFTAETGRIKNFTPRVRYQLNDHWRFTLDYINEELTVDDERIYKVHIANLRAAYQININNSIRLTLQSFKEGDTANLATQLLYSYKVNPFTLFYAGYSDEAVETSQLQSLERTDRTFFVKFSYAWQL